MLPSALPFAVCRSRRPMKRAAAECGRPLSFHLRIKRFNFGNGSLAGLAVFLDKFCVIRLHDFLKRGKVGAGNGDALLFKKADKLRFAVLE